MENRTKLKFFSLKSCVKLVEPDKLLTLLFFLEWSGISDETSGITTDYPIASRLERSAFGPVITPDGQAVLFQWRKENQRVLGKIPITGGEITEQTVSGEIMTAISPDGTRAAGVFFDEKDQRYKVGVRPFEPNDFSIIFNISPLNILVWTSDGNGLLYRELEVSSESNSTIWFQPINGGEPKPFLSAKPETVFNIAQSSDGKKTAVIRGKLLTDAVMLTKIRTE